MASMHPDRAKNLGCAIVPYERGFPVKGRARFDGTRVPRPNPLEADRSKGPIIEALDPPIRKGPQRPTNKGLARRNLDAERLEKARQLAANYPGLRDIEAWRKMGRTLRGARMQNTRLYIGNCVLTSVPEVWHSRSGRKEYIKRWSSWA